MDKEEVSNDMTVSNLPFREKNLIEKAASEHVSDYVIHNDLLDLRQSAYRGPHCTEKGLVSGQNDLLCAINKMNMQCSF